MPKRKPEQSPEDEPKINKRARQGSNEKKDTKDKKSNQEELPQKLVNRKVFSNILLTELTKAPADQTVGILQKQCEFLKNQKFKGVGLIDYLVDALFGYEDYQFQGKHKNASPLKALIEQKKWDILKQVFKYLQDFIKSSEDLKANHEWAALTNLHLLVAGAIVDCGMGLKVLKEFRQQFNFSADSAILGLELYTDGNDDDDEEDVVQAKILQRAKLHVQIFSFKTENLKAIIKYLRSIGNEARFSQDDFCVIIRNLSYDLESRNKKDKGLYEPDEPKGKPVFELLEDIIKDPDVQSHKTDIANRLFLSGDSIHSTIATFLKKHGFIQKIDDKYKLALSFVDTLNFEGYQAVCNSLEESDPNYLKSAQFQKVDLINRLIHEYSSKEAMKFLNFFLEKQSVLLEKISPDFLLRFSERHRKKDICDEFYSLFLKTLTMLIERNIMFTKGYERVPIINGIAVYSKEYNNRASIEALKNILTDKFNLSKTTPYDFKLKIFMLFWKHKKPFTEGQLQNALFNILLDSEVGDLELKHAQEILLESLKASEDLSRTLTNWIDYSSESYVNVPSRAILYTEDPEKPFLFPFQRSSDDHDLLTRIENVYRTKDVFDKLTPEMLNNAFNRWCTTCQHHDKFFILIATLVELGLKLTTDSCTPALFHFVKRVRTLSANASAADVEQYEKQEFEILKFFLKRSINLNHKFKIEEGGVVRERTLFEYIAEQNLMQRGRLKHIERFFLENQAQLAESTEPLMQAARDTIQVELIAQGRLQPRRAQDDDQSVHRTSVNLSASKAAIELAKDYLPEKDLTSPNRITPALTAKINAALKSIESFLINSLIKKLTPQDLANFMGLSQLPALPGDLAKEVTLHLPQSLKKPNFIYDYNQCAALWHLKELAALRWLLATRNNPILTVFRDPKSKLSLTEMLVIVWFAIQDKTVYGTDMQIEDIQNIFAKILHKVQREYNLAAKIKIQKLQFELKKKMDGIESEFKMQYEKNEVQEQAIENLIKAGKREEATGLRQQAQIVALQKLIEDQEKSERIEVVTRLRKELTELNKMMVDINEQFESAVETSKDRPSCPVGAFDILVTTLDRTHPKVKIEQVSGDNIFEYIQDYYMEIFNDLPLKGKLKMREAIISKPEEEWGLPKEFVLRHKEAFYKNRMQDFIREKYITTAQVEVYFANGLLISEGAFEEILDFCKKEPKQDEKEQKLDEDVEMSLGFSSAALSLSLSPADRSSIPSSGGSSSSSSSSSSSQPEPKSSRGEEIDLSKPKKKQDEPEPNNKMDEKDKKDKKDDDGDVAMKSAPASGRP